MNGRIVLTMSDTDSVEFLRRAADARSRITEIPAEEVLRRDGQDHTVIDVRGEDEYAQNHLPGALNLPLHELSERVETDLPDKDAALVCYCNGGNRGALAADALRQRGFSNVVNLGGGLRAVPDELWREDSGQNFS